MTGPADLEFVAGAPADLAPGGVQLRAAPLVLAPSWVSEEDGEARARAVGATTIIKPFVPAAPVEVLREALEELALLLEADLAADPGPALRGAAAFGPRSAVQESLRRMERVRSALEGQ